MKLRMLATKDWRERVLKDLGGERALRAREKTMKGWPRQWKINTIEKDNPNWDELVLDWDD